MIDLQKIRAITIDLDDTLWPITPTIAQAEQVLQNWLAQHAPAAAALAQQPGVRQRVRLAVEQQWPERLHDLSFLRLQSLRQLLQEAGEAQAHAEPAFEVFFDARHQVRLYDDTVTALAFLSARLPVLALSNGNADVHRIGLGQYFVGSVAARHVGVAKPDRVIFEHAAQVLGQPLDAVLHVGDDAHLDVCAALEVGMQAVWVNRNDLTWHGGDKTAHLEVRDLLQLCTQWPQDPESVS
ncbi:MAG: Flavin mononucleotide phosphatase YigB [Pseudomonadota bacterium]|jgi:putative hydrolase of the HAD superfamily